MPLFIGIRTKAYNKYEKYVLTGEMGRQKEIILSHVNKLTFTGKNA